MKRYLLTLIVSLLLSTLLFSQSTTTKQLSIAVGALKGPTAIGMIKLFENPLTSTDGAKFNMVAVDTPDLMVARFASKTVDIAVLPPNLAAKLYNSGLPLAVGAVVGNGMLYLISSDESVKSFADLKGKDVAVAGVGATPEYLSRLFLKRAGLDPDKDLRLNFSLAYSEIAQALIIGKQSYGILPEPFATMALKGNSVLSIRIDFQKAWQEAFPGKGIYPMSVVVIRKSLIQERPQAIREFLSAYESSINSVNTDPKNAGILVEKFDLGLKAAIAEAAIPHANFIFVPASKARESIEALLSLFLSTDPKSIGGKLPDSDFYASL